MNRPREVPYRGLDGLIDLAAGRVARDVYFDEAVYQLELERVFAQAWLCVGHESQIPQPDDYISQYMGEDPVIVWRDANRRVRVFLNSCPHRGMKVCRQESGNAQAFICPYHGWTFDSGGRLVGVPHEKLAFGPDFDRAGRGLLEAPRVDIYAGFVFASWEPGGPTLSTWLGDLRWYLDIMTTRQLGGLEVLPGQQRYRVQSNWKVAAENFAGDTYHAFHSHVSSFLVGTMPPMQAGVDHTVALDYGHGSLMLPKPGTAHAADVKLAGLFGHEAAEYIGDLHAKLEAELGGSQAEVYALGVTNIFPHFSFNDFSAFHASTLLHWHPKGAQCMEVWQSLALDREAPAAIRQFVLRQAPGEQAVSGFFGQDDVENMEQVTEASRGVIARRLPFDYTMGFGITERELPAGPPGRLDNALNESNQRNFYAQWLAMMSGQRA